MKTYQPKNAIEAARLAKSYDRAKQIIADGYTFSLEADCDMVHVCKPGRLMASYLIDLVDGTCDCADFQNRGDFCKHTLAWKHLEDEAEMWNAICAEIEKYEAFGY